MVRHRSVALATIATGALWFASIGANHVWPLAWLAPVPLLAIVPDLNRRCAALASFVASSLGAVNLVIAYAGALPPALLGGVVLLISIPFTAVILAWRALERRVGAVLSAIAYAALVVGIEYVMSLVSPNGTFGSIAYSQTDVLPIVQIASITGLWGISFALSLVAAGVALAWRARRHRPTALSALAIAGISLAAVLTFGVVRLAVAPPERQIRVGLAANDAAVSSFDTDRAVVAMPVIRAYANRAARLAAQGAQVVVLPEKFVSVAPTYADQARAVLSQAARDHRITIVAGFNLLPASREPDGARNAALVFNRDGALTMEYDKVHLVPGLESRYRPGRNIGVLNTSPVRTGVAICKDLDFVALGRAHGQAGAGLLLVPAWDFVRDDWLHSRMAIMRAVEGGYALARTASQGRLTIADARGRIIAEAVSSDGPEVLVTGSVPIAPGGTFYSRTGDWFPWLCIAAVALCASVARRRR